MINNKLRWGNFTSSPIVALTKRDKAGTGFGKPALTYIAEKNFERKLERSIDTEISARPLSWGNLCEKYLLERLLGTEYRPCSQETVGHPTIDAWRGTPDAEKILDTVKKIVEVKSPYTLKSFCTFAECTTIEEVRKNHTDGEKYYWQIVSNAILTGTKQAELIIFCPYKDELEKLVELANQSEAEELYNYYWIVNSVEGELPYLNKDGGYKNLHIIEFDIPEEDVLFLTDMVLKAQKLLTPWPEKN